MIHKALMLMALGTTVAVAGTTVDLQVRTRLRAYELARAYEAIVEGEEAVDAVRLRVLARFTPERVTAAVEQLRERRRLGLQALTLAGPGEVLARL